MYGKICKYYQPFFVVVVVVSLLTDINAFLIVAGIGIIIAGILLTIGSIRISEALVFVAMLMEERSGSIVATSKSTAISSKNSYTPNSTTSATTEDNKSTFLKAKAREIRLLSIRFARLGALLFLVIVLLFADLFVLNIDWYLFISILNWTVIIGNLVLSLIEILIFALLI